MQNTEPTHTWHDRTPHSLEQEIDTHEQGPEHYTAATEALGQLSVDTSVIILSNN